MAGSQGRAKIEVVALLASPGALDALSTVLRGLPVDPPVAIVVQQHLGVQTSVLPTILERQLGRPIRWAVDGAPVVVAGQVTVTPPRTWVEALPDGTWALHPVRSTRQRPHDGLLVSLANSQIELARRRRQSDRRFRALTNASWDVVYRMSPDWTEMRTLDGRGFIVDTARPSTSWLDTYIDPEDQPRVTAAIQQAIRTRSVFELEHCVRRPDGTLGWTLSRAVPLVDDDGQVIEWVGAATDVTARHTSPES